MIELYKRVLGYGLHPKFLANHQYLYYLKTVKIRDNFVQIWKKCTKFGFCPKKWEKNQNFYRYLLDQREMLKLHKMQILFFMFKGT